MVRFTLVSYLKFSSVFVKNHAAYGVSVHYFQYILRERLFFPYLWVVVWNRKEKEIDGTKLEETLYRRVFVTSSRVYFFYLSFGHGFNVVEIR